MDTHILRVLPYGCKPIGKHFINYQEETMKTKTIKIYDFDELSESAKETALDNMRTINNEYYEWWSFTYEDAKTIGLCLTGFDLDRHRHATGNFKDSAECCAHLIVDNHGDTCETYKTATVYLADREKLMRTPIEGDFDETALVNLLGDLNTDFLQSILEDYSMSLQREYEYINSKENLLEVIACNEYTFNVNGQLETA